ncbi:MAG: UbiA family prenyltransferase, partial [Rhodospirillaceae bacterium]|nr:UbiA family prenyltransferase [Rhodospirillaceae bacterium]
MSAISLPTPVPALLRALRPHQWAKNALLFLPLLTAHKFTAEAVLVAVQAFVAFSLCASSVYVTNDLVDRAHDRLHPRKRFRPFAAGDLTASFGWTLAALLLVLAVGLAAAVSVKFLSILGIYYGLTLAYSLGLKRKLMVDVVTLACLYGIRIVAGAAAVEVPMSEWLIAFGLFLFLALALIKRASELVNLPAEEGASAPGRSYRRSDLPIVQIMAAVSGFLSVLVLALYLASPQVARLYAEP